MTVALPPIRGPLKRLRGERTMTPLNPALAIEAATVPEPTIALPQILLAASEVVPAMLAGWQTGRPLVLRRPSLSNSSLKFRSEGTGPESVDSTFAWPWKEIGA